MRERRSPRRISIVVVCLIISVVIGTSAPLLQAQDTGETQLYLPLVQQGGGSGEPTGPITVSVDSALTPDEDALPALNAGGQPRPLAAVDDGGSSPLKFVSNEIILYTDNDTQLNEVLTRWDGTLLQTNEPSDPALASLPAQHIIRIDTTLADGQDLPQFVQQIVPEAGGSLTFSSDQGLRLIAAAAQETAGGLTVDVNWVADTHNDLTTFNDRVSEEYAFETGGNRNFFNVDYLRAGGPLDIGVTEAWIALERVGLLNPSVDAAVIDGGFSRNDDFPANTPLNSEQRNETALGSPNPSDCTGGASCPWHGSGVVVTMAGQADNQYGTAGPGGPVIDALTINHTRITNAKVRSSLTFVSGQKRPSITNMSFGWSLGKALQWASSGVYDTVREVGTRTLLVTSADNNGENVDDGEEQGKRDPRLHIPCEYPFVVCVGAMDFDSTTGWTTNRASYSNFGGTNVADQHYSQGTVDIWAPGTVIVSPDPDNADVQFVSGTSVASPYVAGVAALILAALDEPSPSTTDISRVRTLLLTKVQTGSSDSRVTRWVDAYGAVRAALDRNTPPYIEMRVPFQNATYTEGDTIRFRAITDDLEDGANTSTVRWFAEDASGTDLVLDTTTGGGTFTVNNLCDGDYTIRALAEDSEGATATATAPITVLDDTVSPPANCAPEVTILSPQAGAAFANGSTIDLRAQVGDDPPKYSVTWRLYGITGPEIGNGLEANWTPSGPGNYGIFVVYGPTSTSVSVDVIDTTNTPPVATITDSPTDVIESQLIRVPVEFSATGTDTEDGTLSGTALQWQYLHPSTDTWIDAGTGTNPTLELPIRQCGTNEMPIRLIVTDSGGLSDSDMVTVLLRQNC